MLWTKRYGLQFILCKCFTGQTALYHTSVLTYLRGIAWKWRHKYVNIVVKDSWVVTSGTIAVWLPLLTFVALVRSKSSFLRWVGRTCSNAQRRKSGAGAAADRGAADGRWSDPSQPTHLPFVVVGRHHSCYHLHDLVAGNCSEPAFSIEYTVQ